jgi:hypothetical protein
VFLLTASGSKGQPLNEMLAPRQPYDMMQIERGPFLTGPERDLRS